MTKLSEHIPAGFSMSIISPFKDIQNRNNIYRCKGFKNFFLIFKKMRNEDN